MIETDIPFLEKVEINKLNHSFKGSEIEALCTMAFCASHLLSYQDYTLELQFNLQANCRFEPCEASARFIAYYTVATFPILNHIIPHLDFIVHFHHALLGEETFTGSIPKKLEEVSHPPLIDTRYVSLLQDAKKMGVSTTEIKRLYTKHGIAPLSIILSLIEGHDMSIADAEQIYEDYPI